MEMLFLPNLPSSPSTKQHSKQSNLQSTTTSTMLSLEETNEVTEALLHLHSLPPCFLAPFLSDIKLALTLSSLSCWDFNFVPRDVNFLFHNIAC